MLKADGESSRTQYSHIYFKHTIGLSANRKEKLSENIKKNRPRTSRRKTLVCQPV